MRMAHNETEALMCGDDSFGPAIRTCGSSLNRGGFDFTLLFEQSILSILPSVLLLLAATLRAVQLFPGPRKVKKSRIYGLKLSAICVFGALQLALLVLWAKSEVVRTRTSTAAATLSLLDAFGLYTLSHAEHIKSIRPSSIISVYLLFSTLFDAVQCRTLWLLPAPTAISATFSASIAVKVAMLCFEAREKGRIIMPRWATHSPEELSGVFNRGLFWWLNSLMGRGYRTMLNLDTLYSTDSALDSTKLHELTGSKWKQMASDKPRSLFWSLMKSLKWTVLAAIPPRLAKTGFTFSQPFLINTVIKYISEPEATTSKNAGYGLIGATSLIYIGLAISNGMYEHKSYRFVTAVRGSLVSLIFSKSLDLSATATANVDTTAALSLMSTDVEGICLMLATIHNIWSSVLEAGIAIYLLVRQVSYAAIVPVVVAIGCTVITSYLSKWTPPARAAWNASIQLRVSETSAIIGHMKEIRLLGLTDRWLHNIQILRESEVELSKKARKLTVLNNIISNFTSYITPVGTFGVFVLVSRQTGRPFDVATALTSLSIISLLSAPMANLFFAWPQFAGALGLLARIQTFLNSESRAISIDITQSRTNYPSSAQSSQDMELQTLSQLPKSPLVQDAVLLLKDASYSLKAGELPIVRNVDLTVRKGSLTMIIGTVGSGKSCLLKGILQELPITGGKAETKFTTAAYCDQTSWMINDTIQNNIIGESGFSQTWYETTIAACALDKDFAQLRKGDQSVVGSKGLILSGGQKQRVALARAIYARNEVVIVDDILSGLDWMTEEHVWDNVFGAQGLLSGSAATVIIATHAVRHINEADNIVVMDNGMVVQQGSFSHLNSQSGYVKNLLVEVQEQNSQAGKGTNSSQKTETKVVKIPGPTPEQAQDLTRATGDTTLYRYYGKSIGWFYGLSLLTLMVSWGFFEYSPQVILRWWAEAEVRAPGAHTGAYLGVYALFSALAIAAVGSSLWMLFVVIVPKSASDLHLTLLKSVMGATMSFFFTIDTGITINRFSQDMTLIGQALPLALFGTIWGVISCIASLILVCVGNKYLAAALPFVMGLMYLLQQFYLKTSRQMRYLDLEAKSPLYSHFTETINGLMTIRAFGWQHAFQATNLRLLDSSQKPYYLMFCTQRWLDLVLDMFVAGLAIVLVALAVETKSTTSAGAIGVALINVLSFSQQLTYLIVSWTGLETSLGAIARLKTFEEETPQESEPEEPLVPPTNWPEQGAIDFKNITASYSQDAGPILKDVSFSVLPGQKVALCGRTGSGKSSLVMTLFRLLDLNNGSTIIDSESTDVIHRNLLRSRLNAIPQDPILFPGTVRFNAYPYLNSTSATSPPSDEAILCALETVGLSSIISTNGGLSASMSSIPLSHGQKQLFCLARAVIRKSTTATKILVLDEATANVDQTTEELMMRIIETEFDGYTILAVMHRLDSVVAGFDRVAVLEKGSLVQFGDPKELIREGGAFKEMWDSRN